MRDVRRNFLLSSSDSRLTLPPQSAAYRPVQRIQGNTRPAQTSPRKQKVEAWDAKCNRHRQSIALMRYALTAQHLQKRHRHNLEIKQE